VYSNDPLTTLDLGRSKVREAGAESYRKHQGQEKQHVHNNESTAKANSKPPREISTYQNLRSLNRTSKIEHRPLVTKPEVVYLWREEGLQQIGTHGREQEEARRRQRG
jgi:hypothetical protein